MNQFHGIYINTFYTYFYYLITYVFFIILYYISDDVSWDPSDGFSIQIVRQMFFDSEEYGILFYLYIFIYIFIYFYSLYFNIILENFYGVRNFVTLVPGARPYLAKVNNMDPFAIEDIKEFSCVLKRLINLRNELFLEINKLDK